MFSCLNETDGCTVKRAGMGSYRGAVVIIALIIALLTGIVAGTDTSMEFDRSAPMNAVVAKPVVVTVTPLPCPSSSDYSCMEESRAKAAWGKGGYELWANHPCGYTTTSIPKYCYRKATVTSEVGLALMNRYVPAVTTTTPGRDVAVVALVQRYKPQAEKASPGTGGVIADPVVHGKNVAAINPDNSTEGPWISGAVSNGGIITCPQRENKIVFSGSGGNADYMEITLKIFDVPHNPVRKLPADGAVIGSTWMQKGGYWERDWNGNVPGYSLTPNQDYNIKAMLSDTNYTKFGIRYECTGEIPVEESYITAKASDSTITCQPPSATIRFNGTVSPAYGGYYADMFVIMKIFDDPSSKTRILPSEGVILGTTRPYYADNWEYVWNGAVPGYSLVKDQNYLLEPMLSDTNFLKFVIKYQCSNQSVPASVPIKPGLQQPVPAEMAGLNGAEHSQGENIQESMNPNINQEGTTALFSPLKPVVDFFTSIFGGKADTSNAGKETWLNPQPEPP
jgi:hypothetical protein